MSTPPTLPTAIPTDGISIDVLESLDSTARSGLRVCSTTGVGWHEISAWFGPECLPHDCAAAGAPPHGVVTAVLDVGAAIDAATQRAIKAAVWDNVKVLVGPEAGRVGKVTAFTPGLRGDGTDDVYTVESLMEGKLDARLLDLPTLGWEASSWPDNFLAAKAADKAWQKANEASPYDFPTLTKRHVRLELAAADFERYAEFLTIDDAVKLVILPRCACDGGAGRSYCDVLDASGSAPRAPADHFPSWVFKYDFRTVVETLRAFVDGAEAPAAAAREYRFWFSPATLNQWAAAKGALNLDWFDVFKTTIATIGHTLPIMMPFEAPINLTRAWCVFELFESLPRGGGDGGGGGGAVRTTYLLPKREREKMLHALVHNFDSLAHVVAGVALQDAEGTNPARDTIVEMAKDARADGGESWNAINGAVCAALREWLAGVATAELERRRSEGGEEEVEEGVLTLMNQVGRLLQDQGKLEEAEGLFRRALEGKEATLGAMHPSTLASVNNLGMLLKEQGKLEEAEGLSRRALEGKEATLGAMHPLTLISVEIGRAHV